MQCVCIYIYVLYTQVDYGYSADKPTLVSMVISFAVFTPIKACGDGWKEKRKY